MPVTISGTTGIQGNLQGNVTGNITGTITATPLRADTIQNLNGDNIFNNGYAQQPGQILEYLTSPCDGSTVIGRSGTYTFPNVVAVQNIDVDNFIDVTGSTISYKPPQGTARVMYRLNIMIGSFNIQTISSWRLMVDNVEIPRARRAYSAHSYLDDGSQFEWTFNIGETDDINVGRYSSWNSLKTIKLQSRKWPGGYAPSLHTAFHYPGIGDGYSRPLMLPTLTLIAIS